MKIKVGDLVTGKSKRLLGKRGRVIATDTAGTSKKSHVQWSDGSEGHYFARALASEATLPAVQQPPTPPNVEQNLPTTLVQATQESSGGHRSNEDEQSSSSSESDSDSDFDDEDGPNETHPEYGLPPHNPPANTLQQQK